MPNPYLSIVAPVFKTAPYIGEFYRRATQAARKVTDDYEIIFVNDASPDNAHDIILSLRATDPRVGMIDLAKNSGQHKAIFTGIAAAQGSYVFVLDADLEESPEWLTLYYEAMQNATADVVYGYQSERKGGILERMAGHATFFIVNRLFRVPNRKNVVTATLMNRTFVDNLLQYSEDKIIFSVTCYLTGFSYATLTLDKTHRGASGYSLGRRFAHFMDYIVAVTDKPLIWPIYAGALLLAFGVVQLGWCLALNGTNFYDKVLIAIVLITGGMILTALGTIGLYLANVLANTRKRPRAIIKKFYAPQKNP